MKIKDLIQDDHNFNKGTDEGRKMMKQSLEEFGAGRSVLVDKDNRIIAGNKTTEAALAAGLKDAIVIETTGDELIAVKRTDIDLNSARGRELALVDNATQQTNFAWDEDALKDMEDKFGIDFQEWKVPVAKETNDGVSEEDRVKEKEMKEIRIKFTPEQYNFVLAKLRGYDDNFENALLMVLEEYEI